jgi:hypothetical protein
MDSREGEVETTSVCQLVRGIGQIRTLRAKLPAAPSALTPREVWKPAYFVAASNSKARATIGGIPERRRIATRFSRAFPFQAICNLKDVGNP